MNKLWKWIAVTESLVIVALLIFILWPRPKVSTFVHAEGASALVMVNSRTGEACWAGPFDWNAYPKVGEPAKTQDDPFAKYGGKTISAPPVVPVKPSDLPYCKDTR